MLSNPPTMSGLHSRQRQHRRQNSTPSAFEAVKIAPLPNLQQRAQVSHRRGLSLDTRRHQLAPATTNPRQDQTPVSITTINPASTTIPQHGLPVAQPQRTARPGPSLPTFTEQEGGDAFLLSPQVTPQSRRFAGQGRMNDLNGLALDPYSNSFVMFDGSLNSAGTVQRPTDLDFFGSDSALSTPTFMTFPDSSPAEAYQGWISEGETASTQSRRSSRRISNGIFDKVSKFEALDSGLDAFTQRPCTPSSQTSIGYFSQTPVQTPIKQEPTTAQPPARFSGDYDESMEETLKPIRARPAGIFQDLRQQAEAMVRTPPRTGSIPMAMTNGVPATPDFMNMRNISAEFKKMFEDMEGPDGSIEIPLPPQPPGLSAQDPFSNKPALQPPLDFDTLSANGIDGAASPGSTSPSRRSSPHRRTESVASITSAASIADINIEETRTETGVSMDDIAAFIQGPDPATGKWVCLYENCNKPFGRKENIKSHVQTHLNDRQYQCPTCKKCFVRQHDLKRHAKIHTGIKPYPCQCGQSFARHDALTRHRQRGMCIGAYDGIVRKVAKRGRPKKIRPDIDERRDKAERTRRKNKLTSVGSASSQSGYSDSSAANSPQNDFDGLLDDDPFPGIAETAMLAAIAPGPTTLDPTNLGVSSAPMPASSSSSTSRAETFTALSPSAMSDYSHTSHASHLSSFVSRPPTATAGAYPHHNHPHGLPNPPSPAKSTASHYTHTPPALSSTSSPPPTGSSARFLDLHEPGTRSTTVTTSNLAHTTSSSASTSSSSSESSTLSLTSTASLSSSVAGLVAAGDSEEDERGLDSSDLFLQFATEDGLVSLDPHHGGGNGMVKFEQHKFGGGDEFDPVSMFTAGGDDLYFGAV